MTRMTTVSLTKISTGLKLFQGDDNNFNHGLPRLHTRSLVSPVSMLRSNDRVISAISAEQTTTWP